MTPNPDNRMSGEKNMKIKNYTQSIGKGWSSITQDADGLYGPVATPHGFVMAACHYKLSRLEFVHGGKVYHRYFEQSFTSRRLATLAKRFAKEIATQP